MTHKTFEERLEIGKVNHLVYTSNGREGLVSVWKYQSEYILTWEECPAGKQYDESSYCRDDRHTFSCPDDISIFLSRNGLDINSFGP